MVSFTDLRPLNLLEQEVIRYIEEKKNICRLDKGLSH